MGLYEQEQELFNSEKKKLDKLVAKNKEDTAKELLSLKKAIRDYNSYIKKPNKVKAFFNKILLTLLKKF